MTERILSILRRAGLPLIWVGLLCQAGYLLGYFHHGDRLELYSALNEEGELAIEGNAMRDLLTHFDAVEGAPSNFHSLRISGRSPASIVRAVGERGSLVSVTTLEELHWWAFEPDDSVAWWGLVAMFLGAVIETRQRIHP